VAARARLTAPVEVQTNWPWHQLKSSSVRASLMFAGQRRMEAENFLASASGIRMLIEAKAHGWRRLSQVARTWQPLRLKGIQVGPEFGTPFLAATQVFDVRPIPRKWLSLNRTADHSQRFVPDGTIVVTCSGNVGRATLINETTKGVLISHDLLRVEPGDIKWWGWLYAYLRAPTVRAMMKAAQYGHIIKHLEVHHLDELPIIDVEDAVLADFNSRVRRIIKERNEAYQLTLEAERIFQEAFGQFEAPDTGESGFVARARDVFFGPRRRLDAWHHNPSSKAISDHLSRNAVGWSSIEQLGYGAWLPTRFKRVPAIDGVPFLDSSDLFEINPDVTKRIADQSFGDPHRARVKAGWILLSRSGQIYGLNGSAMIAGHCHEGPVVSDHIIRLAPLKTDCRAGYLQTALTHPQLGRPRVKALPYGSSIPEIEVSDLLRFRVPRLEQNTEASIADCAERAAHLRDHADILENQVAHDADEIISAFLARTSA
jgi:hypothetical protein